MRAWKSGLVSCWTAVITPTHWMPLPRPPTPEARQATRRVGAAAVARYAQPTARVLSTSSNGQRRAAQRGERKPADDHPRPPARQQHAVARVPGSQSLLGEHDLDRDHDHEEDAGGRLRADQPPKLNPPAHVAERLSESRSPNAPPAGSPRATR